MLLLFCNLESLSKLSDVRLGISVVHGATDFCFPRILYSIRKQFLDILHFILLDLKYCGCEGNVWF